MDKSQVLDQAVPQIINWVRKQCAGRPKDYIDDAEGVALLIAAEAVSKSQATTPSELRSHIWASLNQRFRRDVDLQAHLIRPPYDPALRNDTTYFAYLEYQDWRDSDD